MQMALLLLTKQQVESSRDGISSVTLLSKVTIAIHLHSPLPAPPPHLCGLGKVQRKCVQGHCPQGHREERYLRLFGWCKLTVHWRHLDSWWVIPSNSVHGRVDGDVTEAGAASCPSDKPNSKTDTNFNVWIKHRAIWTEWMLQSWECHLRISRNMWTVPVHKLESQFWFPTKQIFFFFLLYMR